MAEVLHQHPTDYGLAAERWRLADLIQTLPWLNGCSLAGLHGLLRRLKFSLKQALAFIHSPDPAFAAKWAAIEAALEQARLNPTQVVVLFLDEVSYYRQPSKARAYHVQGKSQPKALQTPRANTVTRIVAVLNARTGQVTYLQRSKIGREGLLQFYPVLRKAYPDATTIYLVQDNWPVHKLPDVLARLEQERISPLFLPTYASWLNPIEKLWRWLRQQVIHLHRFAGDLDHLRARVIAFLDQFKSPSPQLLRYVGLLSD